VKGTIVACLALILLGACASSRAFNADASAATGACQQRSAEVFAISGEIDRDLAECVRQTFADTTRVLALDTKGGSVEAALDIATVIEGRDLTMRVEGECNSACANYFLPLARRIELAPDAVVLLHGGVDPWTIDRWRSRQDEFMAIEAQRGQTPEQAQAAFERFLSAAEATAARQAAFAQRHSIPPGWLLYRTPGSEVVQGLAHGPDAVVAILVEEPMMRSCLTGVEIMPFQGALQRHWTRSHRRIALLWQRIGPSGRAVCTS
jgi:hypothetical protein